MYFRFPTSYEQDLQLFDSPARRARYLVAAITFATAPWWASEYLLSQLNLVLIYGIVGLGLMLLTGYTGLVSIGHAAFLAVGAYTEALAAAHGWTFPLSLAAASVLAALAGLVVGLPALRLRGIYLAIATMAFGFVAEEIAARAESLTGGNAGRSVAALEIFGWPIDSERRFFVVAAVLAAVLTLAIRNLLHAPSGRALIAIRDSEISAQSMGISLARYKTLAFTISAAITGIAGALYAHKLRFLSPDQFTLLQSIEILMMVVIGGLGSLQGAFLGAAFFIALPQVLGEVKDWLPSAIGQAPGLQPTLFGLAMIAVVLYEPLGIYGRWSKLRIWVENFPMVRAGTFRRQRSYQRSQRLQ